MRSPSPLRSRRSTSAIWRYRGMPGRKFTVRDASCCQDVLTSNTRRQAESNGGRAKNEAAQETPAPPMLPTSSKTEARLPLLLAAGVVAALLAVLAGGIIGAVQARLLVAHVLVGARLVGLVRVHVHPRAGRRLVLVGVQVRVLVRVRVDVGVAVVIGVDRAAHAGARAA